MHINYLELLAGSFAIQCFTKETLLSWPSQDGQSHCSEIDQSPRRCSFSYSGKPGKGALGRLPSLSHFIQGRIASRLPQHKGKLVFVSPEITVIGNYMFPCFKGFRHYRVLS